jgi:hypothetical protein
MNDFGNIYMKFGNEFWLILFWEYISPNLFAVRRKNKRGYRNEGNSSERIQYTVVKRKKE